MSLPEFIAGSLFGSALLASGVSTPSVIVSQLRLQDTHMLQSFISASGISALVVAAAARYGIAPCRVRSPSNYGWFPYDANLIGGLLIGAGMATTGACPGTVLAQIAAGVRSGLFVGVGALLGGVLYTGFAPYLRREAAPVSESKQPETTKKGTMQALLNLSTSQLLLVYEVLCTAMLLAIQTLTPPKGTGTISPIAGGVLIGAAQAASVLLTSRTVGVSTAFQDLGRRFWRGLEQKSFPQARLLTPAVTFAGGIIAGAALLARSEIVRIDVASVPLAPWKLVVGGAGMVFGAGLAGGCPSGHGISGLATFSVSSFVSVAGMFGGGIAVAKALEALA